MTNPLEEQQAKAARREERQARRQARRQMHAGGPKHETRKPPKLSARSLKRMTEEPHEPPALHVRYTGWGLLSPYERIKLPRRRDVKVTVVPQSKRRPWEYQ
jgi:hypothetical protein